MTTPDAYRSPYLETGEGHDELVVPELTGAVRVPCRDIRSELRDLRRENTRLRQVLADLQARNNELDAYAHTVAHDLKNPLSVIVITAAAFTNITDLTQREVGNFLRQIRSTALEMDAIIDNLLLLAEVRKADAPIRLMDMAVVVARVRRRLAFLIKEQHARVASPRSWPAALGYEPWIEEVWTNYLTNAIKYGGRSPVIELGWDLLENGMVRFWVQDHGPGLSDEAKKHLFTADVRNQRSKRPGHGLGLSIVRRIVEKLGGQAGVESQVGRGSRFYFSLPADPGLQPDPGIAQFKTGRRQNEQEAVSR